MKTVPAAKFKARCRALMDQVHATGQSLAVTKHGKHVVKLFPAERSRKSIWEDLAVVVKILGDIESPVPDNWEVS